MVVTALLLGSTIFYFKRFRKSGHFLGLKAKPKQILYPFSISSAKGEVKQAAGDLEVADDRRFYRSGKGTLPTAPAAVVLSSKHSLSGSREQMTLPPDPRSSPGSLTRSNHNATDIPLPHSTIVGPTAAANNKVTTSTPLNAITQAAESSRGLADSVRPTSRQEVEARLMDVIHKLDTLQAAVAHPPPVLSFPPGLSVDTHGAGINLLPGTSAVLAVDGGYDLPPQEYVSQSSHVAEDIA